jgi:hypothetical protein
VQVPRFLLPGNSDQIQAPVIPIRDETRLNYPNAPHPVPLPIRWGEGGRRPGEGLGFQSTGCHWEVVSAVGSPTLGGSRHGLRCRVGFQRFPGQRPSASGDGATNEVRQIKDQESQLIRCSVADSWNYRFTHISPHDGGWKRYIQLNGWGNFGRGRTVSFDHLVCRWLAQVKCPFPVRELFSGPPQKETTPEISLRGGLVKTSLCNRNPIHRVRRRTSSRATPPNPINPSEAGSGITTASNVKPARP